MVFGKKVSSARVQIVQNLSTVLDKSIRRALAELGAPLQKLARPSRNWRALAEIGALSQNLARPSRSWRVLAEVGAHLQKLARPSRNWRDLEEVGAS